MEYQVPVKKINHQFDLTLWFYSQAYKNYMDFITKCNEAVKGVHTTADMQPSSFCIELVDYIDVVQKWAIDYPPEDEANQRFGNKAFRQWFHKVEEHAEPLMMAIFPDDKKDAVKEMSFVIFLLCLYKLELFSDSDLQVVTLRIFNKYIRMCRYLQIMYKMEPAGSRGVHAIDDYQFIPFLWGSAQLIGKNQKIIPDHYTKKEVCTGFAHLSLFLEAVEFIHTHKTGHFHEHSNQLWNISAVQTWDKLNSGMFKMYEAEVLKKFPVVQHTLFGSLFSFERRPDAPTEPVVRTVIDPVKLEKIKAQMAENGQS